MNDGVVFNHHSLPFASVKDADAGILLFIKVLRACKKYGLKVLLVDESQDKSLMRVQLASAYRISDWFDKSKNDPNLKIWCSLLRSMETRQPLFEEIDMASLDNSVEVGYLDCSSGSPVFLAAYHFKTYLISFSTIEWWCSSYVNVWILDLRNNQMMEDNLSLPNLVDEASLEEHEAELAKRRNNLMSSASDIWKNRDSLFPHLTLLQNQIGSSLQDWSGREDILSKARDALHVLEDFCAKWKSGDYPSYRHEHLRTLGLAAEVSRESSSVRNDPKKRQERIFWLPDGCEVYCENHIKLPDGYRIHYYPDTSEKHIYVAYLGPHLTL